MLTSIQSLDDYRSLYEYALKHPDAFWDQVAERTVTWRTRWVQTSDCDFHQARVRWYIGGKLNVAENCLDRHIQSGKGDQPALIWERNEPNCSQVYTYSELYKQVCRFANALEQQGIKKGDRVVFYLPNIPELVIGILGCARIGAIHCVIFGGFSANSIWSRVQDCQAQLIVTANGCMRGAKWIPLKQTVNDALELGCPSIQKIITLNHVPEQASPSHSLDLAWDDFMHDQLPTTHIAPAHDAEDPLFILYTSGSTGLPKGVLHKMGGYLTYVGYTFQTVFGVQDKNFIFFCTADIGWITGHSYLLYGPLCTGVTTVLFEGVPTYPDASRLWQIVDQHQVQGVFTAPTTLRMLAASGNEFLKNSNRTTLRVLGSVGEPINPEAWNWYHHEVGGGTRPIVDTWWQTETGGILISPIAGVTATPPGSATHPLPGILPELKGGGGQEGALVITRSWPGQMSGIYQDSEILPNRFYKTYFDSFPGNYFTGDAAKKDENGNFWLEGRIDDVIKVSGHRLGTAEIESACVTHSAVAEAGVVGVPDAITGEALQIFLVLKPGLSETSTLFSEMIQVVRKEIGSVAHPKKMWIVPALPKTRSGKIMRRVLRKIASGEFKELGDMSTLADPSVIHDLIQRVQKG